MLNVPLRVEEPVRFGRAGRGARKALEPGITPAGAPAGRIPRVARLMALAIRFEGLVRRGVVRDYAELARLGHVTRARVTQVMNLLLLAPDLQEALLFLPRVERGRDPVVLRDLRPVAVQTDWRAQRRLWRQLERRIGVRRQVSPPRACVTPMSPRFRNLRASYRGQ